MDLRFYSKKCSICQSDNIVWSSNQSCCFIITYPTFQKLPFSYSKNSSYLFCWATSSTLKTVRLNLILLLHFQSLDFHIERDWQSFPHVYNMYECICVSKASVLIHHAFLYYGYCCNGQGILISSQYFYVIVISFLS